MAEQNDDDYCGLEFTIFGIVNPFIIKNCVFNEACKWHDDQYICHIDFKNVGTKAVDKEMLRRFLEIAGTNKKLIVQAYVMYFLARQWGKYRWLAAQFGYIWS